MGGAARLDRVPRQAIHVTKGTVSALDVSSLRTDDPKVRFVVPQSGGRVLARFRYRGRTNPVSRLASGEVRVQIALKLRAQDGCNLVYAALRLEGAPRVVVSVKHNPGAHDHAACGARGYSDIRPARARRLRDVDVSDGLEHTLSAWLDGLRLVVSVDEEPVWEGELPAHVLTFDGPAGLRADNARLDLTLYAERREAPP